MKKLLFLLSVVCLLGIGKVEAQGHNIKITVKQMPNKDVILAHYFEGKAYISDTAKLDATGIGYFKDGKKKLGKGMYLLFFSPTNQFDLIIGDNQNFTIIADTLNTLNTIKFENSPENVAFLNFQRFMSQQNSLSRQIREEYDKTPNKESAEVKKIFSDKFEQADKDVRAYIANIVKEYPGSALATFANFTLTPIIPDFSKDVPEGTKDRDLEIQRRGYYYNKNHYWDYANLKDSTLMRTPIFKSKLDDYFNNMLIMNPDSVYNECVKLIEKTRGSKTMFRYMVSYCFNYTLESKIMGMDKAFVNVAKKYYVSGQVDWMSDETMKKIKEEVIKLQYNLIGLTAQELKLPDMDGNWVSLQETKAPFTLLLFWEANCGHCKKTVPQVKHDLLDKFKAHGLKVFAVHTQNSKEEWEKFVTEHDLFDFINCWDPHNQTNYRVYYNVFSTPIMYLLDKDKKIIAKKLDIEQLADMLKNEYKKMGIEIK